MLLPETPEEWTDSRHSEPIHAAFQPKNTVGLFNEPISGLTAFTYVAAWYLPHTGFTGFVTAASAVISNGLRAALCPWGTLTPWIAPASPGTLFAWHLFSLFSFPVGVFLKNLYTCTEKREARVRS